MVLDGNLELFPRHGANAWLPLQASRVMFGHAHAGGICNETLPIPDAHCVVQLQVQVPNASSLHHRPLSFRVLLKKMEKIVESSPIQKFTKTFG